MREMSRAHGLLRSFVLRRTPLRLAMTMASSSASTGLATWF